MLAPVTSFCILACPLLAAFILFFTALSPLQAMKHPSSEAQSMLFGYFELGRRPRDKTSWGRRPMVLRLDFELANRSLQLFGELRYLVTGLGGLICA